MKGYSIRLVIAENIRRKRRENGMTLIQLAAEIHVSYQQVQKYENGTNSVKSEKLVEIAGVFGCRVDELCGV